MWASQQRKPNVTSEELDLDAAIVDLVSRGAVKVPPYPAVALRVSEVVRQGDFGLDVLAKLVSSDQALTADALRCANSAFYGRGLPVTSLNAAIGRIGSKEVVRLALASGLGAQARKPGPLAVLKRRVWLSALASAALAQELAKTRGLPAEEAFVCGLLHDFGKMIGIACIEEILEAHPPFPPKPLEFWVDVVERYHVELGLVLAAQWDLPDIVSDVVSRHHADDPAGAAEPRLVEVVAATDEVVALLTDRTWLTPEDLGAISSITAPECAVVSRVLDRLPAFIASFEGEGSQPPPSPVPSLVEAESADRFLTGLTPADFPVTVGMGRETGRYQATGISSANLMVKGPKPLPENVLLELRLGSPTPLSCWGTAKLSWPEGDAFMVLLQPFALNGPSQVIWRVLVRQTTAGPPPP
jgi:putative nucleotidyltransferase with HDIG domain